MEQNQNREVVKAVDANGKEISVVIVRPGPKVNSDARLAYNLEVSTLIRNGENGKRLLLRAELEAYLESIGIWTPNDRIEFEKLQKTLRASELTLRRGGIKLSNAKVLAISMLAMRNRLLALYSKRSQLDSTTVEAVAESYKFKYLIVKCAFNEDGSPFYSSVDDYEERSGEDISVKIAAVVAQLMFGYDPQAEQKLFETSWLKQHKFMNEDGQLVDQKGRKVDGAGRLINDDGKYIDEDGNLIDTEGNRVDENGNFVVEQPLPFLDDNDNPIDS